MSKPLPTKRTWTYPGVLRPVRLASFPVLIVAAVINSFPLSAFGVGWWLACLVCEFAYHRFDRTINWPDVTPEMLEDAWIAKVRSEAK
jgi:hypothetical protein